MMKRFTAANMMRREPPCEQGLDGNAERSRPLLKTDPACGARGDCDQFEPLGRPCRTATFSAAKPSAITWPSVPWLLTVTVARAPRASVKVPSLATPLGVRWLTFTSCDSPPMTTATGTLVARLAFGGKCRLN